MRSISPRHDRFYELLEPELPRLQAFCRKLVGDLEQGDDLAQDALYDAWRGFGRLREAAAFRSWLYRIVINRYRTNRRKFGKRGELTQPLIDDAVDEVSLRLRLACDRLDLAMADLSASDRALVTLHELDGWSYSELATMFRSSEGALRTRLTRCRRQMRDTLLAHMERSSENALAMGVPKAWIVAKQKRN